MPDFDIYKDYYKVLGVRSDATADELKAAHVKLGSDFKFADRCDND